MGGRTLLRQLFAALLVLSCCVTTSVTARQVAATENSPVISLTDADDRELRSGEWLLEFYANGCAACKEFGPEYREAAEKLFKEFPTMKVAAVNVDECAALRGRFQVSSLPTVYRVLDGEVRSLAMESFTAESVVRAVREIGTTGVPWQGWFHPFGTWATVFSWVSWTTHSIAGLRQLMPWWTFWVGVAVLLILTARTAYRDNGDDAFPPAIIEDRREIEKLDENFIARADPEAKGRTLVPETLKRKPKRA